MCLHEWPLGKAVCMQLNKNITDTHTQKQIMYNSFQISEKHHWTVILSSIITWCFGLISTKNWGQVGRTVGGYESQQDPHSWLWPSQIRVGEQASYYNTTTIFWRDIQRAIWKKHVSQSAHQFVYFCHWIIVILSWIFRSSPSLFWISSWVMLVKLTQLLSLEEVTLVSGGRVSGTCTMLSVWKVWWTVLDHTRSSSDQTIWSPRHLECAQTSTISRLPHH